MRAKITKRLIDALTPKPDHYEVWDQDMAGFLVRITPTGAKSYCIRYRLPDGRRRRLTLGDAAILTPQQARDMAKTTLASVLQGEDPAGQRKDLRSQTLKEFIEGPYAEWIRGHRKAAEGTLARLLAAFEDLLDKRLTELTAWDLDRWKAARVKRGTKIKTAGNRDVACLKAALSKAVQWAMLASNPLVSVKLAKVDRKSKIRAMTADEECRIWAALADREQEIRAARDRHNLWLRARHLPEMPDLKRVEFADFLRPMLTLMLHTGIRRGEAFSIEWGDADLEAGELTIRGEIAKSGQSRPIPLNDAAMETLKAWRAQNRDDVLVFPSPVTKRRFDNINKSWRLLMKAAGVSGLRTHDLRHSCASRLLEAGASIEIVRAILGHVSIQTTQIYLHSDAEQHRAAMQRLCAPPASNLIQFPTAKEI